MKEKILKILGLLSVPLRIGLGLVFIFAAYGKILEPYNFAFAIATYQMMPLWIINIMAIIIPWLEMFTGIMIIVGFRIRANAFIINFLMIIFIIAIWQAIHRDLMLSTCGCFASEEAQEEVTLSNLIRNFFLLAMGTIVMIFDRAYLSIDAIINKRYK